MNTVHTRKSWLLLPALITVLSNPALAQSTIDIPPANVSTGTVLPNGATVNVFDGGSIPLRVDLANGELNVFGGSVALGANGIATGFTNSNNTVNVSGGQIGPFFQLTSGTTLNLSGGTMNTFGVFSGSTANITGGIVSGFPDVFSSGTVNISGGQINTIRALAGSTVNITGTNFELNGVPVDSLSPGVPSVLTQRNVTLSATLMDGSEFQWILRPFDPGFPSPNVALNSATIRLILDQSSQCPADLTDDGELNFFDVSAFLNAFTAADPIADFNSDGIFNFFDVSEFLNTFNSGCP